MTGNITKIAAKNSRSPINLGQSCSGKIYLKIDDQIISEPKKSDIKKAHYILVYGFGNFIKTSEIKLVTKEKNTYTIQTENSIYQLEIL
jgi:hypothetical protein